MSVLVFPDGSANWHPGVNPMLKDPSGFVSVEMPFHEKSNTRDCTKFQPVGGNGEG
ncbi:MAG: hypothetical protein K9N62_02045 [Verrucomicrobia bacterium]|nr:hypothetical protein [Verrucomicrobiota bacterium]